MQTAESLRRAIKVWIVIFIISLVLSGVTAFMLETELKWLNHLLRNNGSSLAFWINKVYVAIQQTNLNYPYLAYGYDWLAFADLIIAVAFIGPLKDPIRNKWLIQFGMIACSMILPLAFIAGTIRGIPFYWRLIDCSFGVIGAVPLCLCYHKIQMLEKFNRAQHQ